MKRIPFRGGTLLAPLPPALVTSGTGDEANILTVAWTGILSTVPPKTYVSVRPSRHSHRLLSENREFVIHLPSTRYVKEVDFCGIYTGAKKNKWKACGFTPTPSQAVACPTIAELPVAIECRVTDILPLGSHDMFMADIVAVTADEALLDENGKLHFEKADLLAYSHGEYYALGKKLAAFGDAARKPKKKHKPAVSKEKTPQKPPKSR